MLSMSPGSHSSNNTFLSSENVALNVRREDTTAVSANFAPGLSLTRSEERRGHADSFDMSMASTAFVCDHTYVMERPI